MVAGRRIADATDRYAPPSEPSADDAARTPSPLNSILRTALDQTGETCVEEVVYY